MASWALALAIVALMGVVVIAVVSWVFFRDSYKKEIASINQRISNLFEGVAKEVLKDGEFWLKVEKDINQQVKASVSPLLAKDIKTALDMTSAEIKQYLQKFAGDRLIGNILKAIGDTHPPDSNI